MKGYFVSANNRITPDNSFDDIGGTVMSTGRAARIEELISNHIVSGHKITLDDMRAIQEDVVDVSSRELAPIMVQLARTSRDDLSAEEQKSLDLMV